MVTRSSGGGGGRFGSVRRSHGFRFMSRSRGWFGGVRRSHSFRFMSGSRSGSVSWMITGSSSGGGRFRSVTCSRCVRLNIMGSKGGRFRNVRHNCCGRFLRGRCGRSVSRVFTRSGSCDS